MYYFIRLFIFANYRSLILIFNEIEDGIYDIESKQTPKAWINQLYLL